MKTYRIYLSDKIFHDVKGVDLTRMPDTYSTYIHDIDANGHTVTVAIVPKEFLIVVLDVQTICQ